MHWWIKSLIKTIQTGRVDLELQFSGEVHHGEAVLAADPEKAGPIGSSLITAMNAVLRGSHFCSLQVPHSFKGTYASSVNTT